MVRVEGSEVVWMWNEAEAVEIKKQKLSVYLFEFGDKSQQIRFDGKRGRDLLK